MAQLERDDANRQRIIAENSLQQRFAALATAERPLDELRRYSAASAAAIEAELANARTEAQQDLDLRMSALRAERDDALRKVASATRSATRAGPPGTGRDTTTPPPPPPKSREQLDIERLLDRYMAAYASRDIEALRRVQELSGAEAKTIRGRVRRRATVPCDAREGGHQRRDRRPERDCHV